MNPHQPANLHLSYIFIALPHVSFFKFHFVFLNFIFNFSDVICEFVPNFEYEFIAFIV
ncbi:hypothetical protein Hanom_Chr12g01150801 [Helianthus anomalus]